MAVQDLDKCCLCAGPNVTAQRNHLTEITEYTCDGCGKFFITQCDMEDLRDSEKLRKRALLSRLSALAREQTIAKRPPFFIQFTRGHYSANPHASAIFFEELLQRWPETVPERLDSALSNLARLSPEGGHLLPWPSADPILLFAESPREAEFFQESLRDSGYLKAHKASSEQMCFLTPSGWERFDELRRAPGSQENKAFVAMWYGDEQTHGKMMSLYEGSIAPAITDAGYKPTRGDIELHNDFIMNKVLGDIRIAPFVVADFTGNRNGVYFEAGFARALKKPVIHTCKRSHFEKAHFDIKQLQALLWDEPGDLQQSLREHIRGTIGQGPYEPG